MDRRQVHTLQDLPRVLLQVVLVLHRVVEVVLPPEEDSLKQYNSIN